MRIESVRIENFRVFKDVTVPMNPYTCLVGPNGAGKSTIINALNVFFREGAFSAGGEALGKEDFHNKDTANPIRITVTFTDLSQEARLDFKHYFRQSKLIISAEAKWDDASGEAPVRQYGERCGMEAFRPFFQGLDDKGVKVAQLKRIYAQIREQHEGLPAPITKDQMTEALKTYEAQHPDECRLIPSEDQFYGVSRGTNRLERHVQWVFVPAVKDASEEEVEAKNTALGKLLARTVRARTDFTDDVKRLREETLRQYQDILDRNQGALGEISRSLARRLGEWAHPDVSLELQWQKDPQKSVSIGEPFAGIVAEEGGFSGSLSRFGHGLQRSYLLSILHELAGCGHGQDGSLILACEEPELYQHPPQIRHLASVLQQLAAQSNQVLVCTHSPWFVSGEAFEDVRMVRKDRKGGSANVTHRCFEDICRAITEAREGEPYTRSASGTLAKINQALQPSLNEIFFAPVVILAEGLEDIAYITSYMILMDKWSDFRRHGCHMVPAGGKSNMIVPLAIARELEIPIFVVFDADADNKSEAQRSLHQQENLTLLRLAGHPSGPFPEETLWTDSLVLWPSNIGDVVESDFDREAFEEVKNEAHAHFSCTGGLGKNSLLIARKLALAWQKGHKSGSLIRLCESVLTFARKHNALADSISGEQQNNNAGLGESPAESA